MVFDDFSRKNDENQGNRRKMKETKEIIYFYEKKHKNESCAVFISDHDPALFRAGIR